MNNDNNNNTVIRSSGLIAESDGFMLVGHDQNFFTWNY